MNRKIVLILYFLILVIICVSCSSKTSVVNDSLNNLKNGKIDKFCLSFDTKSKNESDMIIKYYEQLTEDKLEIVKKIYSYMTFSISENKEDGNVKLDISCINIRLLISDISDKIAASGNDVVSIINTMIKDNSLELNYLTRNSFGLKILKVDDNYYIPYNLSENPELYNTLNVLELLRWMVNV